MHNQLTLFTYSHRDALEAAAPELMEAYTINPVLRELFKERLQICAIPEENILDYLVFRPNPLSEASQAYILFRHPKDDGKICLIALYHNPEVLKNEAWQGSFYMQYDGRHEAILYALPREELNIPGKFMPARIGGITKRPADPHKGTPNNVLYNLTLIDEAGAEKELGICWAEGKMQGKLYRQRSGGSPMMPPDLPKSRPVCDVP